MFKSLRQFWMPVQKSLETDWKHQVSESDEPGWLNAFGVNEVTPVQLVMELSFVA